MKSNLNNLVCGVRSVFASAFSPLVFAFAMIVGLAQGAYAQADPITLPEFLSVDDFQALIDAAVAWIGPIMLICITVGIGLLALRIGLKYLFRFLNR